jgi:restriction endonuclease S subunit
LNVLDCSVVHFNQITSNGTNRRIDSEFFSKRFIENENILEKSLYAKKSILDITTKIDVGYVSSMVHEYVDSGVPLLQTQNIHQFFVDYLDSKYISPEFNASLHKSQVFPGDCLIARSGSIGNTALVLEDDPKPLNSADIIIVRADDRKVTNGYLAAFLNSKIGRLQVERHTSGGVQGHINLKSIERVVVPLISKDLQVTINSTVRNGMSLYHKASEMLGSAELLLMKASGLVDWQPLEPLTYTRQASETFAARRLDAEYYQPKYEALLDRIRTHAVRCKHVEEVADFCERGKQPDYFEEGTLSVINSRHILENELDYDNFERTLDDYWRKNDFASAHVIYGDILTYTTGAKVGRTAIYLEREKALASNHVNILRVREENPKYISVVMNSMIGRWQTEMLTSGSAQAELYPGDIKNFVIPFVDTETQKIIAELLVHAHETRKEARALLESAKRAVEIAIERNEIEAVAYLSEATDRSLLTDK